MNGRILTQLQKADASTFTPMHSDILQRKCACGQHTITGSECEGCRRKRESGRTQPPIQTKLMISHPDDKYEQEADRVVEQVMGMPEPRLQRQAVPVEKNETGSPLQTKPHAQGRASNGSGKHSEVPAIVHDVLRSPGQPLDPGIRAFFGPRFDHDFCRVRVHTGSTAEQSAREVNANAYTVGYDLVFGAGQFAPGTFQGRRLIAHELEHVVQQSSVDGDRGMQSNENRGPFPIRPNHVHVVQRQRRTGTSPESQRRASLSGGSDISRAGKLTLSEAEQLRHGAIMPLEAGMRLLDRSSLNLEEADLFNSIGSFLLHFRIGDDPVSRGLKAAGEVVSRGWRAIWASERRKTAIEMALNRFKLIEDIVMYNIKRPLSFLRSRGEVEPPGPEDLSLTEAYRLFSGVVEPLNSAIQLVRRADEKEPEETRALQLVTARLMGIPGLLRSVRRPERIRNNLEQAAADLELGLVELAGASLGEAAVHLTKLYWSIALQILHSLVEEAGESKD